MKQLPDPAIYEEECRTTPWGKMVEEVMVRADRYAPMCGLVVDLMCGPGYLLHRLHERRPDLNLKGVDNDPRFIEFAKARTPGVDFVERDVLQWNFSAPCDVITCTAGVHHLPYEQQEAFLVSVAQRLKPEGRALIGDPYIPSYTNELERRLGAAELGYAFIDAAIKGWASDAVIRAAFDVMDNDVFGAEYKTSVDKMTPLMEKHFIIKDVRAIWRPDPMKYYGDFLFVLGKKR